MYIRSSLCFPTFHSTSKISRPSELATRPAASRIFSKSMVLQTLALSFGPAGTNTRGRSSAPNKKVGSRPLFAATYLEATQYSVIRGKTQGREASPKIVPSEKLKWGPERSQSEQARIPERVATSPVLLLRPWSRLLGLRCGPRGRRSRRSGLHRIILIIEADDLLRDVNLV